MSEDRITPTLKAVSDAVLAVASERSVGEVLQRLVENARELARARYAALGVPDGEGGFSRFLTAGMSAELIASFGPLPRQHGVLGLMLEEREPYRTSDIHRHPRFRGWWPRGHPDMRSFLGVPIVARDGVIGAFYLTEKIGAPDFTREDEELIQLLAAHAAIAITNARLYEESRELSVLSERNRLALDLHDAVSQKLFGLALAAESAATLLDRDPAAAREQVAKLGALAQEARDELRSLVLELRPPDLERDGLCGALRKHVEVLRRVQPVEIRLDLDAGVEREPARDAELLRIAQEAIHNSLRHARAEHLAVSLRREDGRLHLSVADDGVGFDPAAAAVRSTHLGLTSMEERARRVGARLEIRSAPGRGTAVVVEADA
ncbi:MAG TPA: GAF domain-containing sensor histidine kinase [Gaiellaceae bacterium]|nr:GAF domain-containing sensor histidine kinase [Gaiellaceae bacterium]